MNADPETMNDLAAHSLDLVNREVGNTLEAARRELEDFVDGNAGREALGRAADLLHLAQGALKIIELNGAGMLAEEMELTCRHVRESREQQQVDSGLEALMRAMVQLPTYLERVMSGGRDMALVLLPLLNDLRAVRGHALLSEGTLLLLNLSSDQQANPVAATGDTSLAVGQWARKLRTRFQ